VAGDVSETNAPRGAGPAPDDPVETPTAYASFTRRFRALVIDSAVVCGAFVVLVVLGEMARDVPGSGRALGISLYALLLLYEPVLVARRGGTVGHGAANLRVVDERTGENPRFLRALSRYVLKTLLGLPSFLAMALTRRHQAVHDVLTRTTVRVRDIERASPIDFHYERVQVEPAGAPSRLRRVLVALAYVAGSYVLMSVVSFFVLSDDCVAGAVCTAADDLRATVLGLAWLGAAAASVVAAWRARLWGCRGRPRVEPGELPAM
jgi:uncharacterized RDD family membrane protein YckC